MKATLRLPTSDQYAFIEVETEVNSVEDAIVGYNDAMRLIKPSEGLSVKEWNSALDEYLQTNSFSNADETYFKMNPEQQKIIQEIKKSIKRIDYKNKE